MKRWFCLVFVCWEVVCLLLILGHQASVNRNPQCGWDRSVDLWRESVSTSPKVLLAMSTGSVQTRDGPLEPRSFHSALTTNDLEPSWLDTRGPPGAFRERWVSCQGCQLSWQLTAAWRSTLVSRNSDALKQNQKGGVLQQPLASFRDRCFLAFLG